MQNISSSELPLLSAAIKEALAKKREDEQIKAEEERQKARELQLARETDNWRKDFAKYAEEVLGRHGKTHTLDEGTSVHNREHMYHYWRETRPVHISVAGEGTFGLVLTGHYRDQYSTRYGFGSFGLYARTMGEGVDERSREFSGLPLFNVSNSSDRNWTAKPISTTERIMATQLLRLIDEPSENTNTNLISVGDPTEETRVIQA